MSVRVGARVYLCECTCVCACSWILFHPRQTADWGSFSVTASKARQHKYKIYKGIYDTRDEYVIDRSCALFPPSEILAKQTSPTVSANITRFWGKSVASCDDTKLSFHLDYSWSCCSTRITLSLQADRLLNTTTAKGSMVRFTSMDIGPVILWMWISVSNILQGACRHFL